MFLKKCWEKNPIQKTSMLYTTRTENSRTTSFHPDHNGGWKYFWVMLRHGKMKRYFECETSVILAINTHGISVTDVNSGHAQWGVFFQSPWWYINKEWKTLHTYFIVCAFNHFAYSLKSVPKTRPLICDFVSEDHNELITVPLISLLNW